MTQEIKILLSKGKRFCDEIWEDYSLWEENYRKAIGCFKEVLKIDPYNVTALISLGACFSDCGQHKNALRILRKAEKIGSNDKNLYFNIGVALVNIDSTTRRDAKKYFEKSASMRKNDLSIEAYFDPMGH